MPRQCYGIPYMGSKWRLADWILSYLPDAPIDAPQDGERERERVFVDLFAGGCAMTHAAIKSGRFDKVIANDLSVAPQVFKKAVEQGADDWIEWVSREEFKELDTNTVDGLAKAVIFGFGYKISSYQCSPDNEIKQKKLFEHSLLTGERPCERCRALEVGNAFAHVSGSVDVSSLVISQTDYSDVDIPCGSVVYADPPYKGTEKYGRAKNKIVFDYDRFHRFLDESDFPIFVSEFTCPSCCTRIASVVRTQSLGNSNNCRRREGLYIQSRFVDWYREARPDVVLECDC